MEIFVTLPPSLRLTSAVWPKKNNYHISNNVTFDSKNHVRTAQNISLIASQNFFACLVCDKMLHTQLIPDDAV